MDCSIIPYLILLVFVLVFYICTCKNALTESFAPKQSCSDLSYISNCSDASSSSCEDHWAYVPSEFTASDGSTYEISRSKGKPMRCNYRGSAGCGFKTNNNRDRVNDNWLCKDTPSDSPDEQKCQDNRANNNGQTGVCTYDTVCRDSRANNKKDTNWPGGTDNSKCTYDTVCKAENEPTAINKVYDWPGGHLKSECRFPEKTEGCKDPIAKNYKSTYDIHKQKECEYYDSTRVCRDPDATNYGIAVSGPSSIRGKRFKNADKCKELDAIIKSQGGRNDDPYTAYPRCHTRKDGRWVKNSSSSDGESSGTEANLCREKYCFEWERLGAGAQYCDMPVVCDDRDASNFNNTRGEECKYSKKCKDEDAIKSYPNWKGDHDQTLCVYAGCVSPNFGKNFIKSGVKLDESTGNKNYTHDESKCKSKYKTRCYDNRALSDRNAPSNYPNKSANACNESDYEPRCKNPSAVNDPGKGYYNDKNWPGKSDPSKCMYKGCKDEDANNYDSGDQYIAGKTCTYNEKCKDSNSLEFNPKWSDEKYPKNNSLCKYDEDGPTFELKYGKIHQTTGREYIELNEKWEDPGYTKLFDENDDDPKVTVKNSDFSTNEVGQKVVTYEAEDKYGNTTIKTRIVDILDLVAPKINLFGQEKVTLTIGDEWVDPGVEVTDNIDNDLTYQATVSGPINTNLPGEYTITYSATDNAWPKPNSANPVERTVVVKDTEGPDINLAGDNPHNVDAQAGYYKNIDPGIENVYDDVDDLRNDDVHIVSSSQINSQGKAIEAGKNEINLNKPGDYEIIYEAEDSAGNKGRARRVVKVSDNQPPTIDLINDSVIELAIGDKYEEYGATVKDNIDSDLKAEITGVENINTNKEGTYDVYYSATDKAGNSTEPAVRRQVVVKDKTGPSIQLNGPADMKVPQGSRYIEEGAKANDNIDGPVVPIIEVTPEGKVNTNRRGKYTVTYYAKDKAGNSSGEIERIVHVVDKTPPHITFKNPPGWKEDKPYPGENGLDWGSTYTEYYASLRDDDGKVYDLDDKVTIRIKSPKGKWVSKIDTKIEGVWTVLYNGKDVGGNKSKTIRRKVLILPEPDKIPPQLALNNPIYPGESGIEVGVAGRDDNKYIEYGARALDDDGTVLDERVKIKVNGIEDGVVDTNIVGQYNVEYNVTDLAGNPAQTITRVVYVVDTTKPIITLNGENPMLIDHSSKYEEPGAKAFDNGVDISEHIKIDGRVNVTNEREYIIRYSVTDENGLTTSKSRIVNVIDRFRVLCKEPVFRNLKCEELERNICEDNRVSAQYDGEPYHCIFKDGLCQKGLKCGTRPKQGDEIWLQRLAHKFNNEKI